MEQSQSVMAVDGEEVFAELRKKAAKLTKENQ
jgi:hypothetical protein